MADENENKMELLKGTVGKLRTMLPVMLSTIAVCSRELLAIADDVDEFHKGATIASVTGSSLGLAGSVTTIAGLILAPFTAGASLVVSGIGTGVTIAGGVTGTSAIIVDTVYMKKKCRQGEERLKEVNEKITDFMDASTTVSSLVKDIMSNQTAATLNKVRVGGKFVSSALEVGRMAHLSKVSRIAAEGANIASRGVQAVRLISGVFVALFIFIDVLFVVKGAAEIQDGCKTAQAAQIRECAEKLKKIHEDFQNCYKDLENIK